MTYHAIPTFLQFIFSGEELRVTLRTPLPDFSAFVQQNLAQGEALKVWSSMVDQAADYYLANFPAIGSKGEYEAIGKMMLAKYPAIAQDSLREWVCY